MASPHIHYPQAGPSMPYQGGQQPFPPPGTHVYSQPRYTHNPQQQTSGGLAIHHGPRVGSTRGGYPPGPSRFGPGYQGSFPPPHHYQPPMFTPVDHNHHVQTLHYPHQPRIVASGPVSMGHQNMPRQRLIRGNSSQPIYPHYPPYYPPHAYPTSISTSAPSPSSSQQQTSAQASPVPPITRTAFNDIQESQPTSDASFSESLLKDSVSDNSLLSPTIIAEQPTHCHHQSTTSSMPESPSCVEPAELESTSFPDSCNPERGYALQSHRPRVSEAMAVTVSQAARPHNLFHRLITPLSTFKEGLSLNFQVEEEDTIASVTFNMGRDRGTFTAGPTKSSASTATTETSTAPATPQLGSPQSSMTSVSIANKSPVTTKLLLPSVPSQCDATEPRVSTMDVSPSPSSTQVISLQPTVKKTWASLLKSSDDAPKQSANGLPVSSVQGFSIPAALTSEVPSVRIKPTSELLKLLTASTPHAGQLPDIRARGIVNLGNMCFANTVLQVLVYSPAFHNLFKELEKLLLDKPSLSSSTPLVNATISFMKEFYPLIISPSNDAQDNEGRHDYEHEPFVPTYIYEALKEKRRFDSMRGGQQEDAEEFLGFYLDTLEEELLSLIGTPLVQSKSDDAAETAGGWLEVGKKNKAVVTRTHKSIETPISKIFGGKSRTSRRIPSARETVIVEPWSRLQLDIQPDNILSIDDALRHVATPETVQVISSSRPASQVEAHQQTLIDTLPPVLVLHLKRFLYDTKVSDVVKLNKRIDYGPELEIPREVLYTKRARPPKYKLFGVLNHHGTSATGGHYTLDVLHPNPRRVGREGWVRIDDDIVQNIFEEDLAVKDTGDERSAYLLFYRRMPVSGHS